MFSLSAQQLKPSEFQALVNLSVTTLSQDPIANELIILISQKDKKEYAITTEGDGKAQLLVPKGQSYEVKYSDLIEKVEHSIIEVPGGLGKFTFDVKIMFEPSDMVLLRGLSFNDEGELIEDDLMLELEMMLEVMTNNPKMEIVIAAHSDNSFSPSCAKILTQKQAESVMAYFVKNKIAKERMSAVGIGSEEPVQLNALPEGRAQNNRIEIRVVKKYLNE